MMYAIVVFCFFTVTTNTEGCLNRLIKGSKRETTAPEKSIVVDEHFDEITEAQIASAYVRIIEHGESENNGDENYVSNAYLKFTIQCIQGLRRDWMLGWYPELSTDPLLTQSIRSIIHHQLTHSEKTRLKLLLQNANDLNSQLALAQFSNNDNPLLASQCGMPAFFCNDVVHIIFDYATPDLNSIPSNKPKAISNMCLKDLSAPDNDFARLPLRHKPELLN